MIACENVTRLSKGNGLDQKHSFIAEADNRRYTAERKDTQVTFPDIYTGIFEIYQISSGVRMECLMLNFDRTQQGLKLLLYQ